MKNYLCLVGSLFEFLLDIDLSNEDLMSIILDFKVAYELFEKSSNQFSISNVLDAMLAVEPSLERQKVLHSWAAFLIAERNICEA